MSSFELACLADSRDIAAQAAAAAGPRDDDLDDLMAVVEATEAAVPLDLDALASSPRPWRRTPASSWRRYWLASRLPGCDGSAPRGAAVSRRRGRRCSARPGSTDFETSAGSESDPARPAPQVEPRGTFFVFVLATCDGVAVLQPRMTVFAAALSMA